jgi:hypothetical protein
LAQIDGRISRRIDWSCIADYALPAIIAAALSTTLGLAYAATMFSPGFLLGTSDFWDAPQGITGGSAADIKTTLSGYIYFVRDEWRFPLLSLPMLGAPEGSNAGMLDAVPFVALLGKTAFHLFGVYGNPYGAWSALMFAGNGIAMTFLLRAVGLRSLLAAVAGTGFGLLMPALHYRFGHLALSAHCLVVAALAAYFYRARGAGARGELAEGAIYLLALLTNIYLAAMCGLLFLASTVSAVERREFTLVSAALRIGILLSGSLAILFVLGMIGGRLPNAAGGFGYYSMNLASLVWPVMSYGGPKGQYEGFAYLGMGSIALLVAAIVTIRPNLAALARQHSPLLAVLILSALFALSNEIYLGSWHILHIPLPEALANSVFGHFRSSGRFVWPLMYFLTFAGLASILRSYPPKKAALLIGLSLLLQFVSVLPFHRAVAEAASAHPSKLADKELVALLDASARIEIHPSYQCSRPGTSLAAQQRRVGMQMLAAPGLKPINSVYAARSNRDCTQERLPEALAPGTLYIFLDEYALESRTRYPSASCRVRPTETICSLAEIGEAKTGVASPAEP